MTEVDGTRGRVRHIAICSEQPLPGLEDLEQSLGGNRGLDDQRCRGPNIPDLDYVRTFQVKRNNIVGVHDLIANSYKEFRFRL
jgi:hypothetical protein